MGVMTELVQSLAVATLAMALAVHILKHRK